ncbi:hypothetical protein [Pyrobaculum sp.]
MLVVSRGGEDGVDGLLSPRESGVREPRLRRGRRPYGAGEAL